MPAAGGARRVEAVMGTVVSFDVRSAGEPTDAIHLALAKAKARLHRADAVFSTWKPQSPLNRIRRGLLPVADAPLEVATVLDRCRVAKELSAGWFDPWAMPGGVDPTGLVKGWAAEQALESLSAAGVEAAMVNAGGDIAVAGEPEPGRPWRIGIRDPWDRGRIVAVAEVRQAVATSGTYERGDHVIDPGSGRHRSAVASATVTGPHLDLADAFATALVAAGEPGLAWLGQVDGYQAFLVRHDRSTVRTPGFPLPLP